MLPVSGQQKSVFIISSCGNKTIVKFKALTLDGSFILSGLFGDSHRYIDNVDTFQQLDGLFMLVRFHSRMNLRYGNNGAKNIRFLKETGKNIAGFDVAA